MTIGLSDLLLILILKRKHAISGAIVYFIRTCRQGDVTTQCFSFFFSKLVIAYLTEFDSVYRNLFQYGPKIY